MKHLPYGGSTATRSINCPGWLEKSKDAQKKPAGRAAHRGSMLHEVMEMCLKEDTEPNDHEGFVYKEDNFEWIFKEDEFDAAYIAYNAINKLMDKYDIDELEIEPFVQLVKDEAGGSIDVFGLSHDRKTILIADYKFGTKKVSPEQSDQLYLYAVSARTDPATKDLFKKAKKFVFAIIQPTVKGVTSEWSCIKKDLFFAKISSFSL